MLYNRFTGWINSLYTDLELLRGTENTEAKLKEMFGERIIRPILDELDKRSFIS